MEPQFGVKRAPVDPFGRELETWLRDAPATNLPYAADLLVPPITGPLKRPIDGPAAPARIVEPVKPSGDAQPGSPADAEAIASGADEVVTSNVGDVGTGDVNGTSTDVVGTAAPRAFRRDRGRHASACVPSIPEPPERLALRFDDLAVAVSASTGRTTIERIVVLEQELQVRETDLANLAAWESSVAVSDDPEVAAAHEYVRGLFADLVADAAAEQTAIVEHRQEVQAVGAAVAAPTARRSTAESAAPVSKAPVTTAVAASSGHTAVLSPTSGSPARPSSRSSRPVPLVQPATGPSAIDQAAFTALLSGHTVAATAVPTVASSVDSGVPGRDGGVATIEPAGNTEPAASGQSDFVAETAVHESKPSLWQRFIAGVRRLFGRH